MEDNKEKRQEKKKNGSHVEGVEIPATPYPSATVETSEVRSKQATERRSISVALYMDEECNKDYQKEAKKSDNGFGAVKANSDSSHVSTGRDKPKEPSATDLSFLEDDDDDFAFLSRPKNKPKTSDSITDDALAILLGD